MTKKYKNFVIKKSALTFWWNVYEDGEFIAMVVNESEARRVIWLNTGKGEPITDEMMEVVK